MSDLILHVKEKYFNEIKAGPKKFEYRLQTEYWRKRLVGREYGNIVVFRGYPPIGDIGRRIIFPWRGHEERTITHEHFGPDPVRVFAIKLEMEVATMSDKKPKVLGKMYVGRCSNCGKVVYGAIADTAEEQASCASEIRWCIKHGYAVELIDRIEGAEPPEWCCEPRKCAKDFKEREKTR